MLEIQKRGGRQTWKSESAQKGDMNLIWMWRRRWFMKQERIDKGKNEDIKWYKQSKVGMNVNISTKKENTRSYMCRCCSQADW